MFGLPEDRFSLAISYLGNLAKGEDSDQLKRDLQNRPNQVFGMLAALQDGIFLKGVPKELQGLLTQFITKLESLKDSSDAARAIKAARECLDAANSQS